MYLWFNSLAAMSNTLSFDSTPTSGSGNLVKSGGIYSALGTKQNSLTSPIKILSGKGFANIDLRTYKGHLCYVSVAVDNNAYLLISGWFLINSNVYETFSGVQPYTTTPIYAAFANSSSGIYKLVFAYWGSDKTASTTFRIFVF